MAEQRRGNKNRVLGNGESQRKDGWYMYKYTNNAGDVKYVYSWKLVKSDSGSIRWNYLMPRHGHQAVKWWPWICTIHTVRGVVRFAFQMAVDVKECFCKIIENRKKLSLEPVVYDKYGTLYEGFLYLDKNDMPMVAMHWEKYFQRICEKYNSIYKVEMPKITPHDWVIIRTS